MEDKINQLKSLGYDKEAVKQMSTAKTSEDIIHILKELGVELTEDELTEITRTEEVSVETGELNVEDLDAVNGGGLWTDIYKATILACVRVAIWAENQRKAQAKKWDRR